MHPEPSTGPFRSSTDPTSEHPTAAEEVVEREAAQIDARDPDAPAEIRELIDRAQDLGLPAHHPGEDEG